MRAHPGCAPQSKLKRPRYEVADIFRAHGQLYRRTHILTPEQKKVMWAIENCRTSVLGGHEELCLDCGAVTEAYNSCRNRHCPKCQALDQARWLEQRKQRILPTPYFHVVFTLPAQLRPLAAKNPQLIYNLLFQSASRTLLELGEDTRRLGARLGFTAVLHTWRRDLGYHVHLHCIVTSGGLSFDGHRWVSTGSKHLLPVRVMGKLFRGKFLHELRKYHRQGKIQLTDQLIQSGKFEQLCRNLYSKNWLVYAKRPFAGPRQVFEYLGRYTHRVGISNHRIQQVTDDSITIATRDGRSVSMPPMVFIHRFLQHVLPYQFIKIRHFGLLASSHVRTLLPLAMALLGGPSAENGWESTASDQWQDLMLDLTGVNLRVCPCCGSSRLVRLCLPACSPRSPP